MSNDLSKKYVVTIDANIFHSIGYNFNSSKIAELKKIQDKNIKIILSDIVYHEMIKHFEKNKKIDDQIKQLKKSVDFANDYSIFPKDLISIITKEVKTCDCVDISRNQIKNFCDKYNIEVVDTSNFIDMQVILDMYVNNIAPFEKNKNKSSEFQDAISLIGLTKWAEEQNYEILAISNDNGWKNYADNSKNITVFDSILNILEHLSLLTENQKIHIEKLKKKAIEFIRINESATADGIQKFLDRTYLYLEASSPYCYDTDDEYLVYLGHKIKDETVRLQEIDDKFIKIVLSIDVHIEANAYFYFYVKDSIDKDYINMGSSNEITDFYKNIDFLIELSFDENGKNIEDMRILHLYSETSVAVDFGFVEPNLD